MEKKDIDRMLSVMVNSGELYIIENQSEGMYQIALKRDGMKEVDTANDYTYEPNLEYYNSE